MSFYCPRCHIEAETVGEAMIIIGSCALEDDCAMIDLTKQQPGERPHGDAPQTHRCIVERLPMRGRF